MHLESLASFPNSEGALRPAAQGTRRAEGTAACQPGELLSPVLPYRPPAAQPGREDGRAAPLKKEAERNAVGDRAAPRGAAAQMPPCCLGGGGLVPVNKPLRVTEVTRGEATAGPERPSPHGRGVGRGSGAARRTENGNYRPLGQAEPGPRRRRDCLPGLGARR